MPRFCGKRAGAIMEKLVSLEILRDEGRGADKRLLFSPNYPKSAIYADPLGNTLGPARPEANGLFTQGDMGKVAEAAEFTLEKYKKLLGGPPKAQWQRAQAPDGLRAYRGRLDQGGIEGGECRVEAERDVIIQAVKENQVVIVKGGTGTGKTTQIPKYLLESGLGEHGLIGCTQPRRVAAIAAAKRASRETNRAGIGYSVRFDERKSTKIKYMTEGVLVRELMEDPLLKKYSAVLLDEVHERSLDTEVLLESIPRIREARRDLKFVVMSATIDYSLMRVLGVAPVVEIEGRTHPIRIFYGRRASADYIQSAVDRAVRLIEEEQGNILVFLTGKDDIHIVLQMIAEAIGQRRGGSDKPIGVFPLHAQMPLAEQRRVLDLPGRKCILSTNIAETSVTIPDVRHVVDCGLQKVLIHIPKENVKWMVTVPISKSAADQRAGRTGRTCPGTCHRLYTEDAYLNELREYDVEKIRIANIEGLALKLSALSISPPAIRPAQLAWARRRLWLMGALDADGGITSAGEDISRLPLAPTHSLMVLAARKMGCLLEMVAIVSILGVNGEVLLENRHLDKYVVGESDHMTLLSVYISYVKAGRGSAWARRHHVDGGLMQRVDKSITQLMRMLLGRSWGGPGREWAASHPDKRRFDSVKQALGHSLFAQCCTCNANGEYVDCVHGTVARLSSSSVLHRSGALPRHVVYNEMVRLRDTRISVASEVDPRHVAQAAPGLYTY